MVAFAKTPTCVFLIEHSVVCGFVFEIASIFWHKPYTVCLKQESM